MRNLSEHELTDAVLAKLAGTRDDRLRTLMTALVRHLHDFVREVELTEAEWFQAIQFLTATGQKCDDKRQEFILLSDTLGVSMLVDAINHRLPEGATETTVFGPFYIGGAPERQNGEDIAEGEPGEPAFMMGRAVDVDGRPLAGVQLDVWQTDDEGYYDVQRPERGEMRLRGKFRTDADGRWWFRTIRPVSYPIPTDGPVGVMLNATGRHPYRPAHVHFIVSAEGYKTIVTHLFMAGDEYLDSDAVFGVKNSLIVPFVGQPPGPMPDGRTSAVPFDLATYDFTLSPL